LPRPSTCSPKGPRGARLPMSQTKIFVVAGLQLDRREVWPPKGVGHREGQGLLARKA